MTKTTVGKILLKHHLPSEYHDFIDKNEMDKKGIGNLFQELAVKNPEKYKDAVVGLSRLGFEVSTRQGSTVKLTDLLGPTDKEKQFEGLEKEIEKVKEDIKDPTKQQDKISQLWYDFMNKVDKDLVEIGVKNNQTLAKVIKAGARGSATQYRQTIFSPIMVTDAFGKPLTEFPIKHSFSEGLTLPEYLAASFGARAGAVGGKLAVADSGYFSKQMSRAGMTTKVEEKDCGTENGIEISTKDKDYIGTFLAKGVGSYNRNNEVTSHMLNDLQSKKIDHIVIRSPITCVASRKFHSGAICQMCLGKRDTNHLASIGEFVGLQASSSAGEPMSQGMLSSKHTSGTATKKNSTSGFALINQLANIPKTFKDKAAVAAIDGTVTDVKEAAQGGHFIHINGVEHYVPTGFDVKVKQGDKVEAGDVMSEGLVNPAEIVQHKGIGEGRVHFAGAMKQAFDDSGMGGINKRNFEIIARSAIDHVKITNNDGVGHHLPDEIVSYQQIEKDYVPRPDSINCRIDLAEGKYLETPVLHYTIGTKLNKSMVSNIKRNGIESVVVNKQAPDFEPHMLRLLDIPAHEHDWMHQLYSTYLEKRLLKAVNTGMTSDTKGASPIAGLAYGIGYGIKDPKK